MRTKARRVVHSEMHIKVGMFLWSFLIELFPRFIGIPLILAFGSGTWEQRVQQARNRDMYPYFGKENPVFVNDLFTGFGPGALWVSIVLYVALREHLPYDATLEMINIFIFSAGRAAVLATKYACYQTDYLRLEHPEGLYAAAHRDRYKRWIAQFNCYCFNLVGPLHLQDQVESGLGCGFTLIIRFDMEARLPAHATLSHSSPVPTLCKTETVPLARRRSCGSSSALPFIRMSIFRPQSFRFLRNSWVGTPCAMRWCGVCGTTACRWWMLRTRISTTAAGRRQRSTR